MTLARRYVLSLQLISHMQARWALRCAGLNHSPCVAWATIANRVRRQLCCLVAPLVFRMPSLGLRPPSYFGCSEPRGMIKVLIFASISCAIRNSCVERGSGSCGDPSHRTTTRCGRPEQGRRTQP